MNNGSIYLARDNDSKIVFIPCGYIKETFRTRNPSGFHSIYTVLPVKPSQLPLRGFLYFIRNQIYSS